eukprot:PITA_31736
MQEVEDALSQLKDGKVPGPDGFIAIFLHAFWEHIKTEVVELVEEARSMHWILPSLNFTFIALVPKVEDSSTPDKFRTIALCNVIYKIISKIFANRLKPLLLFSSFQSRQGMILKLVLSKSFDKLNWSYINQMLLAFGFTTTWMGWLMNLITSRSYSILLNGSPSSSFRPSRGIRQGHPLSLFLFVLMAEGLSHLLHSTISTLSLK